MSKGTILPFRRPQPPEGVPADSSPREPQLSDEALLMACVVGEQAALGRLYDRHQQPVHRFVSRITSCPRSTPTGDVEDLVQCTFIEVWKSADRFHGKGTVLSWMFGISANLARHYVRDEVRRRNAMDGLSNRPVHEVRRPDEYMCNAESLSRLAQALSEITYDQRVAFVLCDIEDMSGVEAARVVGVRKGTLWRRLHDARKTLRTKLSVGVTP